MQSVEKDNTSTNISILKPRLQLVFFLIGLIGLVLVSFLIELFTSIIARGVSPTDYDYEIFINSSLESMIVNGLAYLILGVVFIMLIKNETKEIFKTFKNWKPYVAALVGFAAVILFNVVYSIFISTIGQSMGDNANESALNSIVIDFPIASLFIFGVVGPFCEELTYRVGLFSLSRRLNRIFAYIVTLIIFTLIHFDFVSDNYINELLNIPAYAFGAFVLTFLYDKYGLAASLSAHVTNNVFSVLMTIITKIK